MLAGASVPIISPLIKECLFNKFRSFSPKEVIHSPSMREVFLQLRSRGGIILQEAFTHFLHVVIVHSRMPYSRRDRYAREEVKRGSESITAIKPL
ncbi:hypothetical protein AVEN_147414-1 [Araneus ventricosus]|uniref:Uncharacterized protein n=1 Tax=Araneus ventricosus TaxID=182803 RepID=A0A4Y2DR51_ARAVE|nr:hypothetical protein AVEN_147414-1 [Araneus ventricosus]